MLPLDGGRNLFGGGDDSFHWKTGSAGLNSDSCLVKLLDFTWKKYLHWKEMCHNHKSYFSNLSIMVTSFCIDHWYFKRLVMFGQIEKFEMSTRNEVAKVIFFISAHLLYYLKKHSVSLSKINCMVTVYIPKTRQQKAKR